jgi:hypothetical protein
MNTNQVEYELVIVIKGVRNVAASSPVTSVLSFRSRPVPFTALDHHQLPPSKPLPQAVQRSSDSTPPNGDVC